MSPDGGKAGQRRRFREVRGFGVFRVSPPLHFYLAQFVIFAYMAYRFASRNYTVHGLLEEQMFDYPFSFRMELWPVQLCELLNFHFIYGFVPHPPPQVLYVLQVAVIVCCGLGLLGVMPRICALISFLIGAHLTGLMQASNSPVDGGTVALCGLLVLALAPKESFYRAGRRFDLSPRSERYHWPLFLLMLFVAGFYTSSGIAKIVDVGLHWPYVVHLDYLAARGIEQSLFLSSRYVHPFVCALHQGYWTSVLGGWISLIGEVGFVGVLFLPRYRLFFVGSMVFMHLLVFLMAGINFVGSSAILLLCLDWNVLVRRATVVYDDQSPATVRRIERLRRLDWFRRLSWVGTSQLEKSEKRILGELDHGLGGEAVGAIDEHDEVFYGMDAFDQIWCRIPLRFPLALLMRVPGAFYLARRIERRRARRP